MIKKAVCQTVLIRLFIIFLLGVAGQQLWQTYMGWVERPFEVVTTKVTKQEMAYPSVTVCPEGFTLWAGLRTLLNGFNFTDEFKLMLPLTFKQFIDQKLDLAKYALSDVDLKNCETADKFNERQNLCNFAAYTEAMIQTKIEKNVLSNEVQTLCDVLHQSHSKCKSLQYFPRMSVSSKSKTYLDLVFKKTETDRKMFSNRTWVEHLVSELWEEAVWIPATTTTTTTKTTTTEEDFGFGGLFGSERRKRQADGRYSHSYYNPPSARDITNNLGTVFEDIQGIVEVIFYDCGFNKGVSEFNDTRPPNSKFCNV